MRLSVRQRLRLTATIFAVLGASLIWANAVPAASAAPPRVTVIGDSVQASFDFVPAAVRRLRSPGLSVQMEASVCRKLAVPGCLGGSPESALTLARGLGPKLGDVVVLHIGYNDFAATYDTGAMLRALRAAGVRAVVWATLREAQSHYASTNALIRAAARRASARGGLPIVRIADWNLFSAGKPWFSDGIHLNAVGAISLAGFLRENVLAALADVGTSVDGRPVTTRADVYPLGRPISQISGDGTTLWAAAAGRLSGLDETSGRRLPGVVTLAAGEDLVSDGSQAWLRDPSAGALSQPAARLAGTPGLSVGELGVNPLLADAGPWLWAVTGCVFTDPACATGQILRGVRISGEHRDLPLSGGLVSSASADKHALWLLVRGERRGARLEQRDPVSGDLVRSIRLPDRATTGSVEAGRRGAWVLAANGQLLGVSRSGKLRKVLSHIRALAAVGDQLWALKGDRRTILSLNSSTGRARGSARVGFAISRQITFTRQYVWILSVSGRQVVRLRRD